MYESEGSGGIGIWGIAIFLLILFAAWGGWGGNRNAYAGPLPATSGCGCGFSNCNTDRDVLKLETTMTAQNALNNANLDTLARTILTNQDKNTAAILDGQKDLYIRDLERIATQQFITSQNEQTRNLINMSTAQAEAKGAAQNCELNHRLDVIQAEMLKRPPFMPCGALPVAGCSNLPTGCGCGSFGSFA